MTTRRSRLASSRRPKSLKTLPFFTQLFAFVESASVACLHDARTRVRQRRHTYEHFAVKVGSKVLTPNVGIGATCSNCYDRHIKRTFARKYKHVSSEQRKTPTYQTIYFFCVGYPVADFVLVLQVKVQEKTSSCPAL